MKRIADTLGQRQWIRRSQKSCQDALVAPIVGGPLEAAMMMRDLIQNRSKYTYLRVWDVLELTHVRICVIQIPNEGAGTSMYCQVDGRHSSVAGASYQGKACNAEKDG